MREKEEREEEEMVLERRRGGRGVLTMSEVHRRALGSVTVQFLFTVWLWLLCLERRECLFFIPSLPNKCF